MVQSINMNQITDEEVVWKTFPDPKYPFIEADQFGEIRTIDHYVQVKGQEKRLVKGHVLKQQRDRYGYMFVCFGVNGKTVNLKVHRIVATCFIPNPLGLPQVNHKDNNKTNNAVSNLEWCTLEYNM